ncbi:unnamed protein product [Schistocephalus solidus]|uniref:Uncharacterized protein n=1 Tax=Schistocephalus solidus TaxID=70667 RepID=A0A183SJ60_SCHSO|nr:unnamed protein product [Schistocephalus solidus]
MFFQATTKWDLVSNFVEIVKQPALESGVGSVFGAHFSWFSGNSCAYIVAPFGSNSLDGGNVSNPQFVCFTSREHTSLEACEVVPCVPDDYNLSNTSGLGLIVGFFLLSLFFLTLMGLLVYRFGRRSYGRGYRRQRPVPFTLSGNLPGGESVFGLPAYRRSFFHSLAPVRIFDASNASMLTPAPSAATTFKNPLYRPLFDDSLEEPENVGEFSAPIASSRLLKPNFCLFPTKHIYPINLQTDAGMLLLKALERTPDCTLALSPSAPEVCLLSNYQQIMLVVLLIVLPSSFFPSSLFSPFPITLPELPLGQRPNSLPTTTVH